MRLCLFIPAVLTALFVGVACTPCPGGTTPINSGTGTVCAAPPPTVIIDPPMLDAGPALACHPACEHGRALGCASAQSTPHGATCEEFCGNLLASEAPHWNLACRARAPSCAGFDACE
jgi:hypothetical protein